MMFGEGTNINQQMVNAALWHFFTLPLFTGISWALLRLVFTVDAVALVHLAFYVDYSLLCLCTVKCTKEILVIFQWLVAPSVDLG